MKEIKFRAWDSKNKIIINAIFVGLGKVYGMTKTFKTSKKLEDVILMQYTGLKDKNGKEIYEWDIVELYGWGSQKSSDGYAVIEWDVDETGWNLNKPNYTEDRYDFRQAIENCIVVGNIYENPELLDN